MQTSAAETIPPNAPPPDHLVAILSEFAAASEKQTDAIGALARQVASIDRAIEGIGRVFAEAHGTHEATLLENGKEMRKIHQSLSMMVTEVRNAIKRIGPLELEVADLRDDKLQALERSETKNGS